jgi:hypothetical protein
MVQSKVVRDLTRSCLMKAAELLMMTSYLGPDGSWSCVGIALRAPHAFTCRVLHPIILHRQRPGYHMTTLLSKQLHTHVHSMQSWWAIVEEMMIL